MKFYPLIISVLFLCLSGTSHAASHEHPAVKIHWAQTHQAAPFQPVSPRHRTYQLRAHPLLAQRIERRVIERRQITTTKKPRPHTLRDTGGHRAKSRKQAADITRQYYGGKVLKVDKAPGHYRVKVLRDGRVSYHNVPAK